MKTELQNIRALVFDAYGTLLDVKSLDDRLAEHFGSKATDINTVWRQKQLQYTWLRSLMDQYRPFSKVTREALQFACEQFKVELTEEIMNDLMDHYFILNAFPEVPKLLEALSGSYSCAVLSNADMPMLKKACEHNGIARYLDAILSVDTVKINKPAPRVYALAIDHFNCAPEEVLFISSNTWDVAGAAAFGFKAVRLKRGDLPMESLGIEPYLTIESLSELL